MSNRHFSLFMMWIIPLIFMVVGPFSVVDISGWIAHGAYFLDHHELLTHDIFSVLPTKPLVYPSWAISIVYAVIYRALGLTAVCLLHSVFLCALLALIYRNSIWTLKNPVHLRARLAVYLFWLGAVNALGERPSMIALIPLTWAYCEISSLTELSDLTPRFLIKLCLINILWVNLHGSFVLLWLMYSWKTLFIKAWTTRTTPVAGAFRAVRGNFPRILLGHLAIIASCLINPFTYRVFPYVWETMKNSQNRLVPEWMITTPFTHFPTGFLYFLLLIAIIILVIRRARLPGFSNFISSPFFVLLLNGISAIRNATLPFVVLLPFLKQTGLLEFGDEPSARRERRTTNIVSAAFFLLIFVLVLPPYKRLIANVLPPSKQALYDSTEIPQIVAAIGRTGRTCPIFNAPDVGSYLMMTVPNQIFLDSRNIIYTDEEFNDYARTSQALPGWESYLARYQTCFAVLDEVSNRQLVEAMSRQPRWRRVLDEKGNVLFEAAPFSE